MQSGRFAFPMILLGKTNFEKERGTPELVLKYLNVMFMNLTKSHVSI